MSSRSLSPAPPSTGSHAPRGTSWSASDSLSPQTVPLLTVLGRLSCYPGLAPTVMPGVTLRLLARQPTDTQYNIYTKNSTNTKHQLEHRSTVPSQVLQIQHKRERSPTESQTIQSTDRYVTGEELPGYMIMH